ncbi:MAG TPA: hypothetical protein VGF95_02740 [Solirubrobacteraceae bacterium]|jgi:hypothetical protein
MTEQTDDMGAVLLGYTRRYRIYIAIIGLALFIFVSIHILTSPAGGIIGVTPGSRVPAFAVPLVGGSLSGAADIAIHANEGDRGRVPACRERGAGILNICELYERKPVVLALFLNGGSCAEVLPRLQAAAKMHPDVSVAAVAVKAERAQILPIVQRLRLTIPVGFDSEGVLAGIYKMVSCPQLTFILPGGKVDGRPIFTTPSTAMLSAHMSQLAIAARRSAATGGE